MDSSSQAYTYNLPYLKHGFHVSLKLRFALTTKDRKSLYTASSRFLLSGIIMADSFSTFSCEHGGKQVHDLQKTLKEETSASDRTYCLLHVVSIGIVRLELVHLGLLPVTLFLIHGSLLVGALQGAGLHLCSEEAHECNPQAGEASYGSNP
eukprot:1153448-Pelagomonas_calceolata.AAC.2